MLTTTEHLLHEAFSYHAPVERVKKIRDYAFVHFETRDGAMKALKALNGKQTCVVCVCCVLVDIISRDRKL